MELINQNIQHISDLCLKHRVKSLAVFGSILTERFNEESDVDLFVDFEPYDINSVEFDYVQNYFTLHDAFEDLFERKVDLIEARGLRNKYLIANINRNKRVIYG